MFTGTDERPFAALKTEADTCSVDVCRYTDGDILALVILKTPKLYSGIYRFSRRQQQNSWFLRGPSMFSSVRCGKCPNTSYTRDDLAAGFVIGASGSFLLVD